jgi:hypothetical protein
MLEIFGTPLSAFDGLVENEAAIFEDWVRDLVLSIVHL